MKVELQATAVVTANYVLDTDDWVEGHPWSLDNISEILEREKEHFESEIDDLTAMPDSKVDVTIKRIGEVL